MSRSLTRRLLLATLTVAALASPALAGGDPVAALCDGLKQDNDCAHADPEDPNRCECDVVASAEAGKVRVAAVRVRGPGDSFGEVDAVHLAVDAGDGWKDLGEVASSFEPGAFGIHNAGELVSLDAFDVPKVGVRVVAQAKNEHDDSDLGMNAVTSSSEATTWVCGAVGEGGAWRCAGVDTERSFGVDKLMDDDATTPDPELYGPLGSWRWSQAATFDAKSGALAVKARRGKAYAGKGVEQPPAVRPGRYPLEKLLAQPGVRTLDAR